jgi:hypothetical protein
MALRVWSGVGRGVRLGFASCAAFVMAALIGIAASQLGAQDSSKVDPRVAQPERPTVATHAGTVAPGYLEFEAGYEFDDLRFGAGAGIFSLVTKVGIAPAVQFSLYLNGQRGVNPGPPPGFIFNQARLIPSGIGDVAIGFKFRTMEDHPILGDFAVQPILKLPVGDKKLSAQSTDLTLLLISSREIGPVHLDININLTGRTGPDPFQPKFSAGWMAAFSGPVAGGLAWTAELYGYPPGSLDYGSPSTMALLAGPMWAVHKTLVLDAGIIRRLAGDQPAAWFAGATWNVGRVFGR